MRLASEELHYEVADSHGLHRGLSSVGWVILFHSAHIMGMRQEVSISVIRSGFPGRWYPLWYKIDHSYPGDKGEGSLLLILKHYQIKIASLKPTEIMYSYTVDNGNASWLVSTISLDSR